MAHRGVFRGTIHATPRLAGGMDWFQILGRTIEDPEMTPQRANEHSQPR
jgi:hypothetical protein